MGFALLCNSCNGEIAQCVCAYPITIWGAFRKGEAQRSICLPAIFPPSLWKFIKTYIIRIQLGWPPLLLQTLTPNTPSPITHLNHPFSHHLPSPILPSLHQSLSSHLCPSLLSQVKNLRKQVLHFFKEFESLTDEVCVDRFFSLTSKFMSYDVEEFKRCSVEVRKSTGLLAEAHRST